ncbi:SPFH domain-containing protein [Streptomyces sp. NPDC006645]|uniref:SPFH domain-containing protein n=1 Tax=unclassified Streptomyces TaxID=2593676 RepID=UPI0033BB56FA
MTTQTSQPNGDGQMLRGAPALRAAARNALTAREPAEPVDPVDRAEPVAPAEPPEPPAGWYQNVRLLTGPPAEPAAPPHEGEPPGTAATAEAERESCYGGTVPEVADIVKWASAEKDREQGREPGREPGQEREPEVVSVEVPPTAHVGADAAAPEPAAYVEPQDSPERPTGDAGSRSGSDRDEDAPAVRGDAEIRSQREAGAAAAAAFVPEGEVSASASASVSAAYVEPDAGASAPAAYVGPEARPERDGALVPDVNVGAESRTEQGADDSAPAAHVDASVPSAYLYADVRSAAPVVSVPDAEIPAPAGYVEPQDRPERDEDAGATRVADEDASAADGYVGPDTESGPVDGDGDGGTVADEPSGQPDANATSGISAPVWDVSVPAGSGGAVPTRASVTFDSHRWSPLIVGEATHEIPVHLLFRDDEVTGPAAGRPRARRAPVVSAPVLPPAATSRPATPVDTKLVERPGPTLPGWTAALVGVAGLFGCAVVLWWVGAVPDALTQMFGLASNPYNGIGIGMWALLTVAVTLTLFAFGGLGRGRVGHAWVLTLFGEYRGSVRRTGLLWVSPLLLRRRVDVRLRHWRSEPMPAVDANGTALRVVVLVVWRVRDTVRAALGVRDHEEYLREQVEAAMARVLSQLPADAFHEAAPTLRNAEVVGDALTRMLSAECRPVGLDVFSAQPTRIEYAPEISAAMQRSRIAAIDARHRDTVLTSVVDAVDDTVHRLTSRGLVELDDYERKVLVKDLTVAFYTGRHGLNEGN